MYWTWSSIMDARWARVGSTNLNLASWIGNRELDVVVEKDGFVADAACSVAVPPVSDEVRRAVLDVPEPIIEGHVDAVGIAGELERLSRHPKHARVLRGLPRA